MKYYFLCDKQNGLVKMYSEQKIEYDADNLELVDFDIDEKEKNNLMENYIAHIKNNKIEFEKPHYKKVIDVKKKIEEAKDIEELKKEILDFIK